MARQVERYKMKCVYDLEQGTHVAAPRVRKEGEWVRWSDVAPLLADATEPAPNTQSAAIVQIADDIDERVSPNGDGVIRMQPVVLRRWVRQLRAL